jgi:hypothetical protein
VETGSSTSGTTSDDKSIGADSPSAEKPHVGGDYIEDDYKIKIDETSYGSISQYPDCEQPNDGDIDNLNRSQAAPTYDERDYINDDDEEEEGNFDLNLDDTGPDTGPDE